MSAEINNDEVVRDEYGFDTTTALHTNGTEYDDGGFDIDGNHCDTGTEFNPSGRTRDGSRYDSEGYDRHGYDRHGYNEEGYDCEGFNLDGYDSEGYDRDGYGDDGEDRHGNTRCDNGECDDDYCECHQEGSDELLDSDACVLQETGWRSVLYKRTTPTVAFEFECIAIADANTGAAAIRGPYDRAYAQLVNRTTSGEGSIAKHDGSLPDRTGVEFVTVPMTLDEHRKVLAAAFPSGKLGAGAVNAWSHSKCGMHVHLARSSLTNLTLGKMLCFMHQPDNIAFHIDIAGRQTHYASFPGHRSLVSTGLPYKADNSDKYTALNVKHATVEFRIFKPSCKHSTLLKNLCYVLAVRDFCRDSSARRRELSADNFLRWLGTTDARFRYIELDQWLRNHDSLWADHYRTVAKQSIKPNRKPVVAA